MKRSDVEIRDARLAVWRGGTGTPVVFVHGSASDNRTWDAQVGPISVEHEVIVYSRRYHVPNDPISPGADYAMADHVADLETLLQTLEIAPAHIVAHSYGGVMVLDLALRRPELVRSLVLIEPAAFTLYTSDPPRPAEILALLLRVPRLAVALIRFGAGTVGPATRAARRGDIPAMLDRLGNGILGRAAFAALSPARRSQARENSTPEELLGSGFLRLNPDAVRRISCPAFVISGAQSPVLWRMLAGAVATLLGDARQAILPGASHIVHEDAAAGVNAAMIDFLQSADAVRT